MNSLCWFSFEVIITFLCKLGWLVSAIRLILMPTSPEHLQQFHTLTSPAQVGWPALVSSGPGSARPELHPCCLFCWTWPSVPAASCSPQSRSHPGLWVCDWWEQGWSSRVSYSAPDVAAEPHWQADAVEASSTSSGEENKRQTVAILSYDWRRWPKQINFEVWKFINPIRNSAKVSSCFL